MKLVKFSLIIAYFLLIGCQDKTHKKNTNNIAMEKESQITKVPIKKNIVIAHRGSTYWAPEESEPAYLWARNIGADYLEMDLQLTKDNQLVAFHDDNLKRTTNVETIFPERKNASINDFTLAELRKLDIGSWFNKKNPERANPKFNGLKILTLKDIIKIAEGNRLVYNSETATFNYIRDEKDNGNRPGIYVETKHPKSNIEKYLAEELTQLGWNINTKPKEIKTREGKVAIANSKARVILQSFSPQSIMQLDTYLPNIPKCFLLWKPDMKGDLKKTYQIAILFAKKHNVQIIGPSIAGEPNNYEELTADWMIDLIHKNDLLIHPYTFDTRKQLEKYAKKVDGVFTNRADLALAFFNRLK
ncbi:MAG TPA: glycerophosphodiester phosphodiesterase [Flavobacteriia bacterium]|nr:glycerophosphodiester phosphodiesterase [Flavobacteriia bacterium]